MQYGVTILHKYLLLLLLASFLHLVCPDSVVGLCLMISSHEIKASTLQHIKCSYFHPIEYVSCVYIPEYEAPFLHINLNYFFG